MEKKDIVTKFKQTEEIEELLNYVCIKVFISKILVW